MSLGTDWWHAPPEEQARRVAEDLELGYDWWAAAGCWEGQWGAARVCRMRPTRVLHVIGVSEMAERLRETYSGGEIPGWSLQPMPPTRTPLHQHLDALTAGGPQPGSMRGYNLLDRHGFVFAEEVQVCPDGALLDIRNFGPKALSAVREILGPAQGTTTQMHQTAIKQHSDPEAIPARQQRLADHLSGSASTRYREFVHLLAHSRLPLAALDKICTALNSEPVPPADPLVTLLLDTAGESTLLDLYRATHGEHQDERAAR